MPETTQISAYVSVDTKAQLDQFVRSAGLTRAKVIEDALVHHLRALQELPADAIVPVRMVLTPESAEQVRDLVARPRRPTKALKQLLDGD